MHIKVFAFAGKPAAWLVESEQRYVKRLPRAWAFEMALMPPSRKQGDAAQRKTDEWERLRKRMPDTARLILLDERGKALTSRTMADRLGVHQEQGGDLALAIGGPDGFSDAARASASEIWSLSALTLPHELARLVLVEQLYRAHSILEGHPYHRD